MIGLQHALVGSHGLAESGFQIFFVIGEIGEIGEVLLYCSEVRVQ
jgi:hypothetical protein